MKELEGRVGIVTGGSSGIGYAIANVLAENGAAVYVISRTGKVKDGIAPSAPGVTHLKGDITDYDGMKRIVDEIAGKSGLDFLVNNAGITKKARAEVFPMDDLVSFCFNVDAQFFLQAFDVVVMSTQGNH